jgi:hypothetical protein
MSAADTGTTGNLIAEAPKDAYATHNAIIAIAKTSGDKSRMKRVRCYLRCLSRWSKNGA